ncbi:MAG: GMP/IMP nucleotidase [Steroidobacterales bacterium]
MNDAVAVDWSAIDTVLLDMDGTLLDLRFDNWFWQEHIPVLYAAHRGITIDAARARLEPKFRAAIGTIDWYCIDHWSRQLDMDVGAIKRAAGSRVRFLPGAESFLSRLKSGGKRRVLITNAHPETLAIKAARTGLGQHLDASYSAHRFALPKEDLAFWARLQLQEPFEPARTLFIDDNVDVLASARSFGIVWLRAVRCPDSGRPPKDTGDFISIDQLTDLL